MTFLEIVALMAIGAFFLALAIAEGVEFGMLAYDKKRREHSGVIVSLNQDSCERLADIMAWYFRHGDALDPAPQVDPVAAPGREGHESAQGSSALVPR